MLENIHASLVMVDGLGVLLRGKSGTGKSELALQLIDQPGFGLAENLLKAELVADDRVELFEKQGQIYGRAPESLAGLLEIRGLGIVRLNHAPEAAIQLIVELGGLSERMPGFLADQTAFYGHELPILRLPALPHYGPAKVRAAVGLLRNPGQLRA